MDVTKEINKLMGRYNLSREDIASKLGVSAMTVWRWQKGKALPKSRIILKAIENLKLYYSKTWKGDKYDSRWIIENNW